MAQRTETGELRVVRPDERDAGTAQTPGMTRVAGVSASTSGASGVWMGEVIAQPKFRSGAHHHGDVESAIYIISGRLRMRWGEHLEHEVDAQAGDFIFVPAQVVHQEISAGDEPVVAIVARGGQENVVINVELPEAERA
jgi:uncharacterized RmlC-like cupin family protein